MSLIPIKYPPGVCKVNAPYADTTVGGRYTDMDIARFVAGYPEGIWNFADVENITNESLTTDTTGFLTPARVVKTFRDVNGVIRTVYGTTGNVWMKPLFSIDQNTDPPLTYTSAINITPLRSIVTGTLTNPLDTTISSATVTVHHTAHGLLTNDAVTLVTGTAIGGIQPAGVFTITKVDADTYTFVNTSAATSGASGGGGTVSYTYYRIVLTNPFDTTSGSAIVTVHHTTHGAAQGDYVTISNASSVGGVTPNGLYQIQSSAANSYTINVGSNASSTVTGGGGTPSFRYNVPTSRRIPNTTAQFINKWSISPYGGQLVISDYLGTLYIYDPTIGSGDARAYPIYNAPTGVLASFVTKERFIFALGKTGNNLAVSWPDQTDITQWTATASNTANTRTLQEGSYLVGGGSVRDGISLVWTNTACYQFNYTGDNFIYADTIAGRNCGLPGPMAWAAMAGNAYWFSGAEFWIWNGSVQRLPSDDIRDYVVSDYFVAQGNSNILRQLCVTGAHSARKEIWFAYPSYTDFNNTATYCNHRYVIYHDDQGCFSSGSSLDISCWDDSGLLPCPIFGLFSSSSSYLVSLDFGSQVSGTSMGIGNSYIKGSPLVIENGEHSFDIFSIIPDLKVLSGPGTNGVTLTLYGQNYPQDSETALGTFTITDDGLTPIIQTRLNTRILGFKLSSTSAAYLTQWRLGLPRIEAQPAGARR